MSPTRKTTSTSDFDCSESQVSSRAQGTYDQIFLQSEITRKPKMSIDIAGILILHLRSGTVMRPMPHGFTGTSAAPNSQGSCTSLRRRGPRGNDMAIITRECDRERAARARASKHNWRSMAKFATALFTSRHDPRARMYGWKRRDCETIKCVRVAPRRRRPAFPAMRVTGLVGRLCSLGHRGKSEGREGRRR